MPSIIAQRGTFTKVAILLSINIFPILSLAATGLVPCTTCTFSDLAELFSRVMDFILYDILAPLATLGIAYVGVQYLLAFGNPTKLTKVHETGKDILWGIFLAIAGYAIVDTIFNVLTGKGLTGWSLTGS